MEFCGGDRKATHLRNMQTIKCVHYNVIDCCSAVVANVNSIHIIRVVVMFLILDFVRSKNETKQSIEDDKTNLLCVCYYTMAQYCRERRLQVRDKKKTDKSALL